MVPAQAEFAGHRGRRTTGGLPESEGFQLELFGESLSFRHRTPPRGYCPLFEVSTKVGLAQNVPLNLLDAAGPREGLGARVRGGSLTAELIGCGRWSERNE